MLANMYLWPHIIFFFFNFEFVTCQVVEEVAVKLETELTAMRVKAAGLEGSLRARDREVERLGELVRQSKGSEVDVRVKGTKAEEGEGGPQPPCL